MKTYTHSEVVFIVCKVVEMMGETPPYPSPTLLDVAKYIEKAEQTLPSAPGKPLETATEEKIRVAGLDGELCLYYVGMVAAGRVVRRRLMTTDFHRARTLTEELSNTVASGEAVMLWWDLSGNLQELRYNNGKRMS